ncbi:sigma-54-dependent transcriptional regulator [Marinobacterium sediminicola]|uniref:Two-component response regulator CbrB n=1 Tax=Marinobacterium sediminicola TaxID=518898 RepID=A0ABY1S414_9GAMM|nr:sigma-54 dependent transcriptional regulator [Marinobacterium sediminicola]ULG68897.1 sigma-54 dependent transcriptional regulator [Marinobacterium sediminicola]SMR77901.1 Two-component response regulator CbrB [Marinobacterium sediminicola]
MSRILIVEDENIIRSALKRLLEKNGYEISDADSVADATANYSLNSFDLIISDLRLPGAPGTDLIELAGQVPVLIMTSYASLRSAVDAMKLGAVDYIAKPFDHDEMLSTVAGILAQHSAPVAKTEMAQDDSNGQTLIIGSCQAMQELYRRIAKVARTDATVLILGESGTGKELAARSIHEQSPRAGKPMICVNCAAIPETLIESELFGHEKGAFTGATSSRSGLIEAADGGTLFLDEIGELPLEAQARLLRFLQEGEIRRVGAVQPLTVDVRLIAATHRDLKSRARSGQFREDLYYRLYVMELRMPPLRERENDILELAEAFLEKQSHKLGCEQLSFTPEASQLLRSYRWPGNVRELENAIERAVILADGHQITPDLLGLEVESQSLSELESQYRQSQQPVQSESERPRTDLSLDDYFQRFVLENQDQMSETELAKTLGISRKSLWERRQKLGIPRKPKG